MTELIHSATRDGVATITLDSPANRNALSTPLIEALLAALAAAEADERARVIVLAHTGPAFCSGADLAETAAAREAGTVPVSRLGDVFRAIIDSSKPVIARVAGAARAGGVGLIAATDIAICTREATFAFSEVRLGLVPAVLSSTVLPLLPRRAAAELYLTGDVFDGVRAAEIGLVTAAVPEEELDAAVGRRVASLLRGAPRALAGAKALLRRRPDPDLGAEIRALTEMSVGYFLSDDGREGVGAFREQRPPTWVPGTATP